MSAFIVGHDHIDALLTFAIKKIYGRGVCYVVNGNAVEITTFNATEVGRILLTENERSVRERYPHDPANDLPGTIGEDAASYTFKPWPVAQLRAVSHLAILKGCNCFDYQACETDDYAESLACKIVDAIRGRAIYTLPGYDDAGGWEFCRVRANAEIAS